MGHRDQKLFLSFSTCSGRRETTTTLVFVTDQFVDVLNVDVCELRLCFIHFPATTDAVPPMTAGKYATHLSERERERESVCVCVCVAP